MRLWLLFSVVLALRNAVDATVVKGRRTSTTILTPDFVEFVQETVDTEKIQGLTVAIVHKTGPAELGAWGIKYEDGTNMTTDTLFNIASCSKAFLAASLGILIDDFAHGRNTVPLPAGLSTLTWKTKLADILPNEWGLLDPWASQKANLIDILSHVSGLSGNDYSYKRNYSVSDVTRNLRNLRPTFELREQWQYTNLMYMIGANVVSTLSGMRYVDFVNSRIFKPLGMGSSTYSIDAAIQTGKFTGTWTSFGRLIPPWIKEEFVDLMAGPGGVISSVEELAIWTRIFLNGGIDPSTNITIIPSAEFDVVTSAHSIVNANVSAQASTQVYGIGWARLSLIGHDVIMHGGAAPGVSSLIVAAPEDGIGIILLVNADSKGTAIFNILTKAAEIAFGSANSTSSPPANQSAPSAVSRSILPRHAGVAARGDSSGTSPYLDVAGRYYSAGYGALELCNVNSSSPSCESVLDDFRAINKSLSPTDLFASWDSPLIAHARLTYTNALGQYLISLGTVYPEGYGKNSTPFSTLVPATMAQFEVENESVVGFGFNDTDESDLTQAGSVEETSQVWFAKQA